MLWAAECGGRLIRTRTPAFWDTHHHPMITHTSGSRQIPSQNKTKLKLQILKTMSKIQILTFCKILHTRHTFWSCLIRCIDMIWNESNQNCRRYRADTGWGTDERKDGQTDGRSETNIPPNQQLRCVCGIITRKCNKVELLNHCTNKLTNWSKWKFQFYLFLWIFLILTKNYHLDIIHNKHHYICNVSVNTAGL